MTRFKCHWWATVPGVLTPTAEDVDDKTVRYRMRSDDGRDVSVLFHEDELRRVERLIRQLGEKAPAGVKIEISGIVRPESTPDKLVLEMPLIFAYGAQDNRTKYLARTQGRSVDDVMREEDSSENPAA